MASKTDTKNTETETATKLSAAAFKDRCKDVAARIAAAALAETRATVALGVLLLEGFNLFEAQGKDRKTFETWAANVSGKGRASVWNAITAARCLQTMPEAVADVAAGLAVESLTKLSQVKDPEDRAKVLKSAGTRPTTATIESKVAAYHEKHRSPEAKKRENERKRKALDGLAKKFRDPLTTILSNDPDPIALLTIGATLGAKHAKHGPATVVAAVQLIATEYYSSVKETETA